MKDDLVDCVCWSDLRPGMLVTYDEYISGVSMLEIYFIVSTEPYTYLYIGKYDKNLKYYCSSAEGPRETYSYFVGWPGNVARTRVIPPP